MTIRPRWVCVLLGFLFALSAQAASAATEPLRFCVTGDSRGEDGYADVVRQVALLPGGAGQFMIHAGDTHPSHRVREQLDAAFGKTFPLYAALGNHELGDKGTDPAKNDMLFLRTYYDTMLKGKVNPGPEGTKETTYSFDAGDVHIVILNLYWNGKPEPRSDGRGDGVAAKELVKWLEDDLKSSHKTWKLVVGHVPAFSKPDSDWDTSRHTSKPSTAKAERRDLLWRTLEEQGVAAYICGHTHRYSRYQPEGSKVWQIDTAQARGGSSWKYDAFLIVTADAKTLRFDVHRNLKEKGQFAITDTLTIEPPHAPANE